MYAAYDSEEVVSKLPFDATSMTSYITRDRLLIGSKQGHLLSCDHCKDDKRKFEYQVCRTFEKNLVAELKVIESHELILCLTDNQITVHEANEPFKTLDNINKYKPVTAFTYSVSITTNLLLLALASRRKIYIYKWLANSFEEATNYIFPSLIDNIQKMTWCGENGLILAIRNEYSYLKLVKNSENGVDIEKPRFLFNTGSRPTDTPLIVSLENNNLEKFKIISQESGRAVLGLCKDNFVAFIDEYGEHTTQYSSCRFSDAPLALAYDSPYLVGVLARGLIEIRSVQAVNSMLIQKIQLDKASTICCGPTGSVYVGSDKTSWKLSSKSLVRSNIKFLVDEKHFELAILLAEQNDSFIDPVNLIEIKRRMALNLFNEKQFSTCFNIHLQIKTDVLIVMNLIPQMIPEKYLAVLSRFNPAELAIFEPAVNLAENERKSAILAMGDYLSMKRTEFAEEIEKHYKDYKNKKTENLLSTKDLKKKEATLELIDSVLLKCFLVAKPMLVSSLLRLPDNSCIISEAEKDLFSRNKYCELLILYERKKMHKKALELLKRQSKIEESIFFGVERMCEYLQTLNNCDLRLIFEYAPLVFAENVELGIEVFTINSGEQTRNLDKEEVLEFLRKECPQAIISYLEHIIYNSGEKRPKFHEDLAEHYITQVKKEMKDYIQALKDDEIRVKGGEEEGQLGVLRKKLFKFLEFSNDYSPQKLLAELNENLWEERAIICGKLKLHEEALAIYSNILLDFEAAERHCNIYYSEKDVFNIYFILFKTYAVPLENCAKLERRFEFSLKVSPIPNVAEALKVLRKYANRMNTVLVQSISLIPLETPLNKVWEALEAVFETLKNSATSRGLLLSITELAAKKSQKKLKEIRAQKIFIDDTVNCVLCKRKIGTSAFVRLTDRNDKALAHSGCYKKL